MRLLKFAIFQEIGRYLIVLHLLSQGMLSEPTLTISPWFEARPPDYYDRLLGVSARGDWDGFVRFFAPSVLRVLTQAGE